MFFDICRTRVLVMGFTSGLPCKARCTVPVDMSRALAMSKSVTRRLIVIDFGSKEVKVYRAQGESYPRTMTSGITLNHWGWISRQCRPTVFCNGYGDTLG